MSVQEFYAMMQRTADYTLLDVRRDDEVTMAQYPRPFLHIELSELPQRLHEVPTAHPVIVACRSGGRSAKAAAWLTEHGFADVYNLAGGMLAWQNEITPQLTAQRG